VTNTENVSRATVFSQLAQKAWLAKPSLVNACAEKAFLASSAPSVQKRTSRLTEMVFAKVQTLISVFFCDKFLAHFQWFKTHVQNRFLPTFCGQEANSTRQEWKNVPRDFWALQGASAKVQERFGAIRISPTVYPGDLSI